MHLQHLLRSEDLSAKVTSSISTFYSMFAYVPCLFQLKGSFQEDRRVIYTLPHDGRQMVVWFRNTLFLLRNLKTRRVKRYSAVVVR